MTQSLREAIASNRATAIGRHTIRASPAGVVHESKPDSPGKTINAFIVEKGKPLINPVQKP